MYKAARDAGFSFDCTYASHILTCVCQDHLRLCKFDLLQKQLTAETLTAEFGVSDDETIELTTVVVESVLQQLLKQCTKSDCKVNGPYLTNLQE
eukprot:6489009-Amphidinium_carterae.1